MTTEKPRREITVNGRRVTVIDLHAHCAIPEAQALVESRGDRSNRTPGLPIDSIEMRLDAMNEQAIDIEALSINPFWYTLDRDLSSEIIRIQNEKLEAFCAATPDRFVGLASVALQHPDLAAEQLETGMKRQGLKGCLLGGSVAGEELADRRFDPFWAKAEELGAVVFIHPQGTAELESRLQGNGTLTNIIGNPLETTIALSHLIFEGTLDRHPGLKILGAHAGGYLPSYAGRSDASTSMFRNRVTPMKKKPSEYLRELYFDSMVFTSEGLRHLVAETGASQIVLGTDWPYPWTTTAVEHVLETPELTDDERIAILGGNAAKLLGI